MDKVFVHCYNLIVLCALSSRQSRPKMAFTLYSRSALRWLCWRSMPAHYFEVSEPAITRVKYIKISKLPKCRLQVVHSSDMVYHHQVKSNKMHRFQALERTAMLIAQKQYRGQNSWEELLNFSRRYLSKKDHAMITNSQQESL